jgi:hypothetical protein
MTVCLILASALWRTPRGARRRPGESVSGVKLQEGGVMVNVSIPWRYRVNFIAVTSAR